MAARGPNLRRGHVTSQPDQTELYREALTAIHDALDIPYAAAGHDLPYTMLLERRAVAVATLTREMRAFAAYPDLLRLSLDEFRDRVARMPVTYARFQTSAEGHPDECRVCGPGCCSPVLAVHTSCPGPLVGATVASTR